MKTNNPNAEEALSAWQGERRSSLDEVDITFAVMASIQPLVMKASFQSSPWLEAPSIFVGLLRSSIALFLVLTPV